ncbi:hypothetical protein [Nostoc sp. CMAA1605]|uniref:hypothetical protein n=1 Tax=Nostoc sp. CMAA1605 TaxID=2055159 RepID=UPI001F1B5715|nr:hypothetical protein [Nostoc sp. CMAA1605]MCF4966415.1 hypothetical protein [Nostoc sp. CMAA1605]
MRRFIFPILIYIVIADILVSKSAMATPKVAPVNHEQNPVIVGGFFDDVQKGIEDLNNTIRGVRNTVNEVNQLQNDINGKNTQNTPNNQNNTINPTPEAETKPSTQQPPQHNNSQPSQPESSINNSGR